MQATSSNLDELSPSISVLINDLKGDLDEDSSSSSVLINDVERELSIDRCQGSLSQTTHILNSKCFSINRG